jgi:lipopolysaccharide/colanic/teichoic acid biosynthesis glycosyltransferase
MKEEYNMEDKSVVSAWVLEKKVVERKFPLWKRAFDILFAAVALIITSPFMAVISLLVLITDGQPITFKQKRIGLNGKSFEIIKFRSMCRNAEEVLHKNAAIYQKYMDNGYKLSEGEDPRVTKLGAFLRKTSLDELPQFWNVLTGSMSIVGPRPIVPVELNEYGANKKAFLSMKPGVTGVWQVSGRSDIVYPQRIYLELSYLNKRNLVFDMLIIIKTIFKILERSGAH